MTRKHVFLIPDATGHSTKEFDRLDAADMDRAWRMFETLVKDEKKVAYTRNSANGGGGTLVRKHDPEAEETVFFDPLAGG